MGAVDDETIKVPWKQQKNTVRGSSWYYWS
jgi:hypothetical protein